MDIIIQGEALFVNTKKAENIGKGDAHKTINMNGRRNGFIIPFRPQFFV